MQKKRGQRLQWMRLLTFLFVVGLSLYLFLIRGDIAHLGVYGYPGIFLFSLLANATIIVPMPSVIVTSASGSAPDEARCCAALGELSGYLAGFSGQAIVERVDWHVRLEEWMKKYGEITILVLAFIPNPAFDMAGLSAGALKMPMHRFLIWCWLGKMLKMLLFAYGGSKILDWLRFW